MIKKGIDELHKKTGSIFKLSILVAKRAQEISQGANKLIDSPINEKPTVSALKEIITGKVNFKESEKNK